LFSFNVFNKASSFILLNLGLLHIKSEEKYSHTDLTTSSLELSSHIRNNKDNTFKIASLSLALEYTSDDNFKNIL
jgi:hypothetical protein